MYKSVIKEGVQLIYLNFWTRYTNLKKVVNVTCNKNLPVSRVLIKSNYFPETYYLLWKASKDTYWAETIRILMLIDEIDWTNWDLNISPKRLIRGMGWKCPSYYPICVKVCRSVHFLLKQLFSLQALV